PAVHLKGEQAWSVAQGFAKTVDVTGCIIHACCVMAGHTHLVIARHTYQIEKLVIQLKGDATERLKADGRPPMGLARSDGGWPTMWGRGSWNVFLDTAERMRRKIRYTVRNPLRLGHARQRWHFVTQLAGYDGFED